MYFPPSQNPVLTALKFLSPTGLLPGFSFPCFSCGTKTIILTNTTLYVA